VERKHSQHSEESTGIVIPKRRRQRPSKQQ